MLDVEADSYFEAELRESAEVSPKSGLIFCEKGMMCITAAVTHPAY